jgi:hypothetical protein
MDKKLLQILMDFSMSLHSFEENGGDLPEEIDDIWMQVTSVIENDKMPPE